MSAVALAQASAAGAHLVTRLVAAQGDTAPPLTSTGVTIIGVALGIFALAVIIIVVVDRKRVKQLKADAMDRAPRKKPKY